MKVSESSEGLSESYVVRFWHIGFNGYQQEEQKFYSDSNSAHDAIEKYALKCLNRTYAYVEIIRITYC